jgi:hypothetical protein
MPLKMGHLTAADTLQFFEMGAGLIVKKYKEKSCMTTG